MLDLFHIQVLWLWSVLELEFDFEQSICQPEVKNDGQRQLVSKSLRFANIWAPHGATFLFSFDV